MARAGVLAEILRTEQYKPGLQGLAAIFREFEQDCYDHAVNTAVDFIEVSMDMMYKKFGLNEMGCKTRL
uniref:Uncharacterized protein n=1 Tax=Coccidioides posadasii RMSCC 3488 TaxID=454284 RepID=A0A0J6FLV1_COCPO|nr:hypothetical protein CPAG_07650 [Coccidioides posadasii RMSCC 3488]